MKGNLVLSKIPLLSLCLVLVLLGSGCGEDKKKEEAVAAKEWAKSTPPADYLARAKGIGGPPAAHGGAPAAKGAAPTPK